jgi:hypothetical protein
MVGPHVVGVGQPVVLIEAVLEREKLFVMTQMPFSKEGGGVALLFYQLGEEDFALADPMF